MILLREIRDYRWWFLADTSSALAASVNGLALPLAALAISGSLQGAGALAAVCGVVGLLCSPFGGVILDRIDRRTGLYTCAALSLTVWLTAGVLLQLHMLPFWGLCVLSMIGAVNGGLFGNSSNVALLSIVSNEAYVRALAANQARDATITLLGPVLGGLLYGFSGALPFLFAGLCSATVVPAVAAIKADLRPHGDERPRASSVIADLREGVVTAFQGHSMRVLLLMAMFVNVVSSLLFSLIMYQFMDTHVPAVWIGLADGVAGVCMVAGSLLVPQVIHRGRPGTIIATAVVWFGIALLVSTVRAEYWVLMVCQGVAVLPIPLLNSLLLGYYFSRIPRHLQGRSQSVLGLCTGALVAFSPLVVSLLLPRFGYSLLAVVGACIILAVGTGYYFSKASRAIPLVSEWQ